MKSKILCILIAFVCSFAAFAAPIAITYPSGGEIIAPGRTISMTWSNAAVSSYGCLMVGIYEEPLPGMDPAERVLIAPCFIFPDTVSCTNVQNVSEDGTGFMTSYPVTIPADTITSNYRLHIVIIDSDHNVIAEGTSGVFTVATISSTIDLIRPAQDLSLAAGSSVNIKFTTADVAGPIDIQLVDTTNQANWYSSGQALVNPNSKGVSSSTFAIRTDIPPGPYGIRLVGTSVSSGSVVFSPSSPTIRLTSSITTPKQNASVKKGKKCVVAWKGKPPVGVDTYSIYFMGDVTVDPILLGSVSALKNSAPVIVPMTPDMQGQFILVGKAWEITGNTFRLK